MGINLCNVSCTRHEDKDKKKWEVLLEIILSCIMSKLKVAGCHGSLIGGNHIYGVYLKVYLKV